MTPYNHPNYHNLPPQFPPDYATAWGEDHYGIWIEITVECIVQRLRWIPKGVFTMGSSEGEQERSNNEVLHEVTLTQGFWLADTTCTQVLWQAVMGNNPANFKDDLQNPVESVSWLDAQQFLSKLNQTLPSLKAHLPTEAQWEYACRAGTTTPFAFGENITPELVNYNGNYPYADAEKGQYRQKTLPVTALPANSWGLYQMHGNVWEWCLDEYTEDLGKKPLSDPVNASFKSGVKPDLAGIKPEQSPVNTGSVLENSSVYDSTLLANAGDSFLRRVLRGGSWIYRGRYCRSAIRNGNSAGDLYRIHVANYLRYHGFRIALGH